MYEFTRNLLGRARFLYMEFYVRQSIASFAFMIFFCISYTLTIDVMADDLTSSRVGIDARSINRAYLTSFAAITNYDVRVHHWRSKIPSEETDLMNVQTTVEDVKYRLVANLNEPTCLLVESRSMIREATDKLPKSLEVRRYLSHYADGKAIFRTGGGSIFSEQPQPFSFEKFCQNSRVNRPAFMAIYPAYKFQGTAIEQTVSSLARAPKPTSDVERKLIVQELSSRLIKITTSPPPKAIGMTTTWVDTERLLPTKVAYHLKNDSGEWYVYYSHDVEYEKVNECFVPTRITYSATGTLEKPDRSKKVSANEVGTIELTWFHVNVDKLEMPKLETLGVSLAAWDNFVNPKKDPFGNDTDFERK